MLDTIGSTKAFIVRFDTSGNVIGNFHIDEYNKIRNSDEGIMQNGRIVKYESRENDSLYFHGIAEFDDQNFFSAFRIYRPVVDTLVYRQVLTHDGKGNYTKIETFNSQGTRTSYRDFQLDEQGRVIETRFYRKDTLLSTLKNTYNEKGQLVKTDDFDKTKLVSTWDMKELTADDHGNSLEVFCDINNGKYKIIIARTYVYY